jgi:hypothetical protein
MKLRGIHQRIFQDIIAKQFDVYSRPSMNWVSITEDIKQRASAHPGATDLEYVTRHHIEHLVRIEAEYRMTSLVSKRTPAPVSKPKQPAAAVTNCTLQKIMETTNDLKNLMKAYGERIDSMEEAINEKTSSSPAITASRRSASDGKI